MFSLGVWGHLGSVFLCLGGVWEDVLQGCVCVCFWMDLGGKNKFKQIKKQAYYYK